MLIKHTDVTRVAQLLASILQQASNYDVKVLFSYKSAPFVGLMSKVS